MNYLALYRKYRPVKFEDVCGQEKIVQIIHNSIINNKIFHAYLFCGPRGTGKTTTAKLIARMVNCITPINGEPCGKCQSCISVDNNNNGDIIEIDAASNNGVDEIREIRDKVNLVPSISKYKVYIIDEVHMLSIGAFNALLKTLEEPPKHVIFILATTEEYKIPLTIVSRCQKFNFNKISNEDIVNNLQKIAELEKIDVNKEILYEIARFSDGGMRDSINMLDQLSSYNNGKITFDDVYNINGIVTFDEIFCLFKFIINKDLIKVVDFVDNINTRGISFEKFITEFIIFLKDLLLYKSDSNIILIKNKKDKYEEINLLCNNKQIYDLIEILIKLLNEIKNNSDSKLLVEINLIKIIEIFSVENKENISGKYFPEINSNSLKLNYFPGNNLNMQKNEFVSTNIKNIRINNTFSTASKKILMELKTKWGLISDFLLDNDYGVVAGLLKDCDIVAAGANNIIIVSDNLSVVERLNEMLNIVEQFLNKIYGYKFEAITISKSEWFVEKNNYIKNKNNKIKYEYIEEKSENIEHNNKNNVNNAINDLISIVGNDIIDFK